MHLAATISRYVLGIVFLIFGVNGFAHFIPQPPMPPLAMQFFGLLIASHLYVVIFGAQVLIALSFLSGRFVPLALVALAPILVNILSFHVLMAPAGIGPGIFVTILWAIVAADHRRAFDGLLSPTTPTPPARA